MIHRTFIEFSLTQNSRKNTFEKEKTFNVDNFFLSMCLLFQKKVKNSKLHTQPTHTEQFSALGYACRKHDLQKGSFLGLVYVLIP